MIDLIKAYEEASKALMTEAVRINDMLAELSYKDDLPEAVRDALPTECCVGREWLDLTLSHKSVVLEYGYADESDYDCWEVPRQYFGMTDEQIVADFTDKAIKEYEQDKAQQLELEFKELVRLAKQVGYKLVKSEGEV
jgi:hypothetical protein